MEIETVFLRYIITPLFVLVSTIIMTVFNKKNKILSNKKLIVGLLIVSLLLSLPGLLGFVGFSFMPWGYIVSQVYIFLFGLLFTYLMLKFNKDFILKHKGFLFFGMLVSIFLGMYLYQLAFNWLNPMEIGWWISGCLILFMLPTLFWWSYVALLAIPPEFYKLWKYPEDAKDVSMDHLDFDKLLVLELALYKRSSDMEPLKVKVKAPDNMCFGIWFQKFIDDYNAKFPGSPVVFQEKESERDQWMFFVRRRFFRKNIFIDPDLTIEQNKINEKMTIHAKRVMEKRMVKKIDS